MKQLSPLSLGGLLCSALLGLGYTLTPATALLQTRQAVDSSVDRPLPSGPLGEVIRLGRDLVAETTMHPLTAPFSGNDLNCTSCHLQNGTHETAASFLGVAPAYPAWLPDWPSGSKSLCHPTKRICRSKKRWTSPLLSIRMIDPNSSYPNICRPRIRWGNTTGSSPKAPLGWRD